MMERDVILYEDKNRRVCETIRGISDVSERAGEEGFNKSYETSLRSQVLQRAELEGSSKSEPDISRRYGYIYITENLINGKCYIGQHKSKTFDKSYKGSGVYLTRSIEKYGWENFRTYIIEWVESIEELNSREVYWINLFDAVNDSMFYNLALGGMGGDTYSFLSESDKNRIKEITKRVHTGKVVSEETSRKRVETFKRNFKGISDETRRRLRESSTGENNGFYNKTHSDEVRKVIGDKSRGRRSKMKGKKFSDESKKNMGKCGVSVLCVEENIKFSSFREAARFLGVKCAGCIKKCADSNKYGLDRMYHGYHWKYIEEEEIKCQSVLDIR